MIRIQGKQAYCPSEHIVEPMPHSMTNIYDNTNVYENNSWKL
jgi:hypothetical protein